jgi:asparagine synthase (glutamine-hydrolysing)
MYALEVRVPMLDHEVVNFVVSLPSNYKIMNKKRKIILNKAFQDYLPEFVFNRPKHGFEVPLDYWLNDSLSSYVEELTREDFLKRQNLFNIEQIKNLKLMLKSTNKSDSAMIMWNLLVFQHWWKKNYL